MAQVLVGTSGFVYAHWRDVFYPRDVPERLWLPYFAARFPTVELNGTFYRLPLADAVARWRTATPARFVFAAKGSRYLTHMKRLLDAGPGLERFFTPLRRLGRKLQVVLWQLPPRWAADPDRLDRFLRALPRTVRHAVEFREPSWYVPAVCDVLDRHRAAFCEHDMLPERPPRLTGGFRYLRFHGTTGRYAGRYGHAALAPYARDLARTAARGVDAYVYFNNDVGGHALSDARDLQDLLDGAHAGAGAEAPV